jgi:hypothetical protein
MPKNYVYMKYFTFIENFTYGNTVNFLGSFVLTVTLAV